MDSFKKRLALGGAIALTVAWFAAGGPATAAPTQEAVASAPVQVPHAIRQHEGAKYHVLLDRKLDVLEHDLDDLVPASTRTSSGWSRRRLARWLDERSLVRRRR